jgi:uncharacterized protein (TIGR02231 family)
MKAIITSLVFAPVLLFGQHNSDIILNSSIKEVTLYLNSAEIKTTERVNIKKGTTRVVFAGISPYMLNESIQCSIDNNLEIVSIRTKETKNDITLISKEALLIGLKIKQAENKLKLVNAKLEALDSEKKMLAANYSIDKPQAGVSIIELGKVADFFRERIYRININILESSRETELLSKSIDSLTLIKKRIEIQTNSDRKEISIVVNSNNEKSIDIALRYLVENARWEPTYDIIGTEITKPILLKYKANIFNETGIEWDRVKIKLSTADPSIEATLPQLTTWTLNYNSQGNEGYVQNRYNSNLLKGDSIFISSANEVIVDELSYSFEIDKPHSISSSNEAYNIQVKKDSIKATFQYLAIPKIEASAFLLAKITGWQKLNLIDAPANVYFQNTYVGVSNIKTRSTSDTLELSFGRDNKVFVSRSKLEDKGEAKFIGTKRNESLLYEITIKNNRSAPIEIKIQDQLPVSQESDIVVEENEISNAAFDKLSGRLQWIKTIRQSEVVKLRIGFTVKFPKNKNVLIRKNRSVASPRFRH